MRVAGWLVAVLVAMVAGCGDGGPSNIDLNGQWQFEADVGNQGTQTTCQMTGTATLSHAGSSFSGTAVGESTCSGPGGVETDDINGAIADGQVDEGEVVFVYGSCTYTGSAQAGSQLADAVDRMFGSVACINDFTGTWQANR